MLMDRTVEAEGNFVFREEEHGFTILKQLNVLRANGDFCDVDIIVGEKIFPAHRCVLSSSCSYFNVMFTVGLSETRNQKIEMHGIQETVFENLLTFLYTGVIKVHVQDVQPLFIAANMLQLLSLRNACGQFIESKIDPTNCLGFQTFAESFDSMPLMRFTRNYTANHFVELSEHDEFLELHFTQLLELISRDDLRIDSESDVLGAALKWIFRNLPVRITVAPNVFAKVRLSLISENIVKQITSNVIYQYTKNQGTLNQSVCNNIEEILNHARRTQLLTSLSKPRTGARKFIYIIGGYSSPDGKTWLNGDCLSSVEKYGILSNRCESYSIPLLIGPRRGHCSAFLGGRIYVFGGEYESLISSSVECFDPSMNRWKQVGTLSTPRCGMGIVVIEDTVLLIGGCIGSTLTKNIDKYDIKFHTMEKLGELNSERAYFSCTVNEEQVFLSGGLDEFDDYLSSAETFDPFPFGKKGTMTTFPKQSVWRARRFPIVSETIASMKYPRAYFSVVSWNNFLYAIGGQSDSRNTLMTIEQYNINKDVWEVVSLLPSPRSHLSSLIHEDNIYIIGGKDNNGNSLKSILRSEVGRLDWTHVTDMVMSRCDMPGVIF